MSDHTGHNGRGGKGSLAQEPEGTDSGTMPGAGSTPVVPPAVGLPTPRPRALLCPYCGEAAGGPPPGDRCAGLFDPLSRQATQNSMGPWWIKGLGPPTRPGCSYDTLRALVARGRIVRDSVVRGPSTHQFWTLARRTPGVAHLLGICHSCQRDTSPDAYMCNGCGAAFEVDRDRQHMGLGPVRPLPGQASDAAVAAHAAGAHDAHLSPALRGQSFGLSGRTGPTGQDNIAARKQPSKATAPGPFGWFLRAFGVGVGLSLGVIVVYAVLAFLALMFAIWLIWMAAAQ